MHAARRKKPFNKPDLNLKLHSDSTISEAPAPANLGIALFVVEKMDDA